MSDPYQIRPARREDCPGILEIYNHAVLHTTATYDYEPRSLEHRQEWFDAHQRDEFPICVAEDFSADTPSIVGWSSLSRYHDRPGFRHTAEDSIYVAADRRGLGLGSRLLAPLIPAAKARGLHAILAAIDASNEASLRLHSRFGFQKVGHLREVGFKFGRWLDVATLELLLPTDSEQGLPTV